MDSCVHIAALRLARQFFPVGAPSSCEADPDSDDEWVAITVMSIGSIEETLDCEDRYTEAFLAEVPWPCREKLRLAYRFASNEAA